MLKTIKRYLGVFWILISVLAIVALIIGAITNIDINGKLDINKPMPWIIIIVIFIPIAFGLSLFGWYALQDEYSTKK
jgi:thiol:disulfide interchange protein